MHLSFVAFLDRSLMRAAVQFNAIAGKDAEYTGAASVTAGFPDVIDGDTRTVHPDYGHLTVQSQF